MGIENFKKPLDASVESNAAFESFDKETATSAQIEAYIKYLKAQIQMRKIDDPAEAQELEGLVEEMMELLAQKSLTE